MAKAILGIVGGSGIYDLPGLSNAQSKESLGQTIRTFAHRRD
jgi:hypothetical protein